LLGQVFDEGRIFARPEATAALAQVVLDLDWLPLAREETLLRLSRAFRRAGKGGQAEQVLRTIPRDATPATEARRVYFLGSMLRDLGRWQEALVWLRQAKAAYQALGVRDGILTAGASIAETLALLGQHEDAARELDAAESEGQGASLEVELAYRIKHALSLRMRGLLRKAYSRCEDVLRRAKSARLLHLIVRAETEMGIIHALLDDAPGAVRLLTRAIVAKRQLGDNRGLKQAYLSLGFAHATTGDIPAARAAYEQSLALNQETNDVYGELLCLEFLLRLDPNLVKQPELLRALTLANRTAEWKNPQIQAILNTFNERLSAEGATHEPV
jgi:tetratricopeptide (TPR) repeat protein